MIKIVDESGQGMGTKILDEENNDICRTLAVESIDINIKPDGNRAAINVAFVKTEIKTDVVWLTKHPVTNQFERVSSIWFADGTNIAFNDNGITVHNNDGIVKLNILGDDRTYKFKETNDE